MSSALSSPYMRPPRHFSNKENASYAPGSTGSPSALPTTSSAGPGRIGRAKSTAPAAATSSTSGPSVAAATIAHLGKPRMGGIGRAPKRSATSAARHQHGKPYDRSTSVSRAKERSVAPKHTAPLASVTSAATAPASRTGVSTISPTGTAAAPTNAVPRAAPARARIPTRLPRPNVAPVTHLPGDLAEVPPLYALHRLRPLLPRLLRIVNEYRPLVNDRPEDTSTLPFGYPAVMNGDSALGERIRGQEPDVVLSIIDRANPNGRPRVFPACAVVYATQCSSWPPTAEAQRAARAAAASQAARSSRSSARATVKLDPIEEDDEDTSMESGNVSLSSSVSSVASTSSSTSSAAGPSRMSTNTEAGDVDMSANATHSAAASPSFPSSSSLSLNQPLPPRHPLCPPMGFAPSSSVPTPTDLPAGVVRLPIMNIPVPHPASFSVLHTHLHMPLHPLMPMLLGIAPHIGFGMTGADDEALPPLMANKSYREIIEKLEFMRGFWSNLCAMGVSTEHTWMGLSEAWVACVRELERRGVGTARREVGRGESSREGAGVGVAE